MKQHEDYINELLKRAKECADQVKLNLEFTVTNMDGEIENTTVEILGEGVGIVVTYEESELFKVSHLMNQVMVPKYATFVYIEDEVGELVMHVTEKPSASMNIAIQSMFMFYVAHTLDAAFEETETSKEVSAALN